ncbi:hypothetical protein ACWGKU_07775 [Kitasatospora sp. NPDC054768]
MSVATWWWIVALTTVLFWAPAVPPQPTRTYRIMVSLAPVAGALFLCLTAGMMVYFVIQP